MCICKSEIRIIEMKVTTMEEKQEKEVWMTVLLIVLVLCSLSVAWGHFMDWSLHLGERLFALVSRVMERLTI